MEYFEVPKADLGSEEGICSDNECPCGFPGTKIPHGAGYMYISDDVVKFRQHAKTVQEAQIKIALMSNAPETFEQDTITSTLMCEQGARKRGLDLDVAAADAKYWWETGLVPLRATPLIFEETLPSKSIEALSDKVEGDFQNTSGTMLEVEASTLEEAKSKIREQIPDGYFLVSEKIIFDGKPQAINVVDKTISAAFTKAQSLVPTGATILAKKELAVPKDKSVEVTAWDESSAKLEAKQQFHETAIIVQVKTISAGKKGFWGIGKKPTKYAVLISQKATVEVLYETQAKIQAKISQEDPAVYGEELVELRSLVKEQNGVISCLQCASELLIDIASIENDIRKNQALADSNKNIHFAPSISEGMICKNCKGVVCSACAEASLHQKRNQKELLTPLIHREVANSLKLSDFFQIRLSGKDVDEYINEMVDKTLVLCLSPQDHSTILCPKCKQELLRGIDHITD